MPTPFYYYTVCKLVSTNRKIVSLTHANEQGTSSLNSSMTSWKCNTKGLPLHKNKTTLTNYLCLKHFYSTHIWYNWVEAKNMIRLRVASSLFWLNLTATHPNPHLILMMSGLSRPCIQTQTKSMDKEKQACICKAYTVIAHKTSSAITQCRLRQ